MVIINSAETRRGIVILSCLFLWLIPFDGLSAETQPNPADLPVPGMVTMIDLGAKKCVPCKMMAPILDKMRKAYAGKAAIVFIDVWKNKGQARRFGIRAIPTQIFYDSSGREKFRHVGFLNEAAIAARLQQLGVDPPKTE